MAGLLCGINVPATEIPEISATVGLSSFMALSDGHLQKMADSLKILAKDEKVRTGDWEKIRDPLWQIADLNVEAVNWFALPNGEYGTLQQGRVSGHLSGRRYFPKLLEGSTILGDLVLSRSTGKSVAIVAVPVYGKEGRLVGALGASVHLDSLADRLRTELGVAKKVIYSFDSTTLVGINRDPT